MLLLLHAMGLLRVAFMCSSVSCIRFVVLVVQPHCNLDAMLAISCTFTFTCCLQV
jgi:hypothetical protein